MDEMIERVMAAMKEASYVEGLTFEQERRHIARAAIEAMRKPTDDMLLSGNIPLWVWEAMIDAALSTPLASGGGDNG